MGETTHEPVRPLASEMSALLVRYNACEACLRLYPECVWLQEEAQRMVDRMDDMAAYQEPE